MAQSSEDVSGSQNISEPQECIIVPSPIADLSSSSTSRSSSAEEISYEDLSIYSDSKDWTNEHFAKVHDPESKKFVRICLAGGCDKQYSAGISTLTYKRHWKKYHSGDTPLKKTIFLFHDEIHISRLVKAFIFLHWDYKDIDKREFKEMLASFNPNKTTICRKTLSSIVTSRRQVLAKMIAKRLEAARSIALTFDLWSDRRGSRGFGCVTGHYIDTDGHLVNLILNFERIEYPHDAPTIANFLSKTIQGNKLEGKVVSITTDNASNNILALTQLSDAFELEMLTHVNISLVHYKCAAHVLNLGVQAALNDLKDLIKDVRDTVLSIRKSGKRKEAFLEVQRQLIADGIQETQRPLELLEDIEHRWNSTYLLVERALVVREAITRTLEQSDSISNKDIDWTRLYCVKTFLEPFYEATRMICVQSDATISVVPFVIPRLINHCEEHERSDIIPIQNAALSLREKLTNYECELYHQITNLAYVLDPRYKTTNLSRSMSDTAIAQLRVLMDHVPSEFAQNTQSSQSRSIFHDDVQLRQSDELDAYLTLPCERTDSDCLVWWRNNYRSFRKLWAVARAILNVQGTSVASERAFSIAGEVDTPSRNQLSSESVENIVLFRSWMDYLNLE